MQQTTAQSARDQALNQVTRNASSEFMQAACDAIRELAATQRNFIVDDVWTMRRDWPSTPDKRAMGGAMRKAQRDKLIEPTTEFRSSAQIQCHANPRRVWRSLVQAAA